MGASEAQLAEVKAVIEQRNSQLKFDVWPENWHAVSVFVGMATQWRWIVGSRKVLRTGLVYEVLDLVMRGVTPTVRREHRRPFPVLLQQLQVMEGVVLKSQGEG